MGIAGHGRIGTRQGPDVVSGHEGWLGGEGIVAERGKREKGRSMGCS